MLAALLGACSMDRSPLTGACVEGQSIACQCEGADDGAMICRSDGSFGACDCSGEGGASVADGDTAIDGSGGTSSGSDAGAGSGAVGGTSGDPGGAGVGAGAGAGAGAGGSGAGAGGVGGMASAGAGGAGTGAIDAGAVVDAPPPGVYAECGSTAACMGDLECVASANRGGTGYCTVRCRDMQGTVIADCPSPASGTVTAACNTLTGLCQLGSCLGASCPDGMSCVAVWGGFAGMFCQY